jgi:hypothetical protein
VTTKASERRIWRTELNPSNTQKTDRGIADSRKDDLLPQSQRLFRETGDGNKRGRTMLPRPSTGGKKTISPGL